MTASAMLENPTEVSAPAHVHLRVAQAVLPDYLLHELQRHFSPRRLAYVARVLSVEELRIIGDLQDALILARIKRMAPQRLARFDRLVPRADNHRAYVAAQMEWLKGEHYLLGTRLGRSPTHSELLADFMAHRNGQRFRAYYALKHPRRMSKRQPAL